MHESLERERVWRAVDEWLWSDNPSSTLYVPTKTFRGFLEPAAAEDVFTVNRRVFHSREISVPSGMDEDPERKVYRVAVEEPYLDVVFLRGPLLRVVKRCSG